MNNTKQRVDPRILRTRKLIKEAFIDLLQEMEINKITVNGIAERATINRVTFYLHYNDIQDMLEKMAQEMVEDIETIMMSPPAPPYSLDDNRWLKLETLLEYIAQNAKFYKVVLSTRRTSIFTERLLNILSEIIKERSEHAPLLAAEDIQSDIAIWYGSSALIGTIAAWLRKDMPYTPRYLAKQLSLLLQFG